MTPVLDTPRLTLRPPRAEDFPAWAAFMADPESARGRQEAAVGEGGRLHAADEAGAWALQGFGMFSVIERASGEWVGRVGPRRPPARARPPACPRL